MKFNYMLEVVQFRKLELSEPFSCFQLPATLESWRFQFMYSYWSDIQTCARLKIGKEARREIA